MKDRIHRTGTKKVNHRLTKTTGIIAGVSLLFATVLTAGIVYLAKDNIAISETIHHYGEEIDYIENQTQIVESRYRAR
jgi:hypothetical protein